MESPNVTFREAFITDVERINEINNDIFVENYTIEWLHKLILSDTTSVIVAIDDTKIIGYIIVALKRNPQSRLYGCIVSITVLPEYRRKGYARELLRRGEDKIKQMQVGRVGLMVRKSNEPAMKLYLSEGYARQKKIKKYYKAGTSKDGTEYFAEDGFHMIKWL